MKTLAERLKFARLQMTPKCSQQKLANMSGLSQTTITMLENGTRDSTTKIVELAKALGVSADWLSTGNGEMQPEHLPAMNVPFYRVEVAEDDDPSLRIPYLDVRGSCGGGAENGYDALIEKGYLVKERGWFNHFGVNNKHLYAIYCDGDSMYPFLSDGDMVIIDTSRTKPINGKVFAVDTPAGTRIKRLKQSIFGTWTLESDNPDKRTYPDETIPPEMVDQVVIRGIIIYRQGGVF